MSAVRMCDRCGNVFSERADNWGTFAGTTNRRDAESGRIKQVTEQLDLGPCCNGQPAANPAGVTAIAGVPEAERLAEVHAGTAATVVGADRG